MRISIDFDGCCWSHMGFFRKFMRSMSISGHQVGMLSSHSASSRDSDIRLMVARGFPTPNFWIGREEGDERHPSEIKAESILREKIDMHFDDFDFGDPLSVGLFQRILGPEFYRVMWVTGREPVGVHYE